MVFVFFNCFLYVYQRVKWKMGIVMGYQWDNIYPLDHGIKRDIIGKEWNNG